MQLYFDIFQTLILGAIFVCQVLQTVRLWQMEGEALYRTRIRRRLSLYLGGVADGRV